MSYWRHLLKKYKTVKIWEKNFFYRSDYSPVVNNVIPRRIIDSSDRFTECEELISNLEGHKTLIYFATFVVCQWQSLKLPKSCKQRILTLLIIILLV